MCLRDNKEVESAEIRNILGMKNENKREGSSYRASIYDFKQKMTSHFFKKIFLY